MTQINIDNVMRACRVFDEAGHVRTSSAIRIPQSSGTFRHAARMSSRPTRALFQSKIDRILAVRRTTSRRVGNSGQAEGHLQYGFTEDQVETAPRGYTGLPRPLAES
ncbi:hypothetical protein HBB16_05645 [Pseudonocardia sp. MCCB 268]|nr:hypothetical protein [Pseudonocardia cytotoxica]